MKKQAGFLILLLLTAVLACTDNGKEGDGKAVPDLVMQIQKCARLYSTECRVHRIITHNDTKQLSGSILNQDFSIELPLGKRSVAIPIEATVKAYVDFSGFSADNVRRSGDKIEIVLPDPQIELTSTRICHDEVKQYVPLLRANFTDEELTALESEGREAIVADLPGLNLTEMARQNAARVLIPMLAQMGFDERNVTITFRKYFTPSDFPTMLKIKD